MVNVTVFPSYEGTFGEVQLRSKLKATTNQNEREIIAAKIAYVRAIFAFDGLRSYPLNQKEITRLVNVIGPINPATIMDVLKEMDERFKEEAEKEKNTNVTK